VDKFSSDFEKLADETGVIFIPNVLDGLIGKPKYMSSDNIHPNDEGYAKIADKVYKVIKNYLK
jgi:lysophospholipase L1-like esterase